MPSRGIFKGCWGFETMRVAVTTAPDRASSQVEALQRRGLEPVLLPCIQIHPGHGPMLERARSASSRCDWLVLTSPRAVHILWPDGGMPRVRTAAVGSSTAAAIVTAGGTVGLVGDRGAAGLVMRLAPQLAGRSVLFPHAAGSDPGTITGLEAAGARLTAIPVYEARPVGPAPDLVDGVLFGSPSAIEGWCLTRSLDDLVVAVIGDTTEHALARRGRAPDVVATRPDFDALADAIHTHPTPRKVP